MDDLEHRVIHPRTLDTSAAACRIVDGEFDAILPRSASGRRESLTIEMRNARLHEQLCLLETSAHALARRNREAVCYRVPVPLHAHRVRVGPVSV